jgi:hypothetical protein
MLATMRGVLGRCNRLRTAPANMTCFVVHVFVSDVERERVRRETRGRETLKPPQTHKQTNTGEKNVLQRARYGADNPHTCNAPAP